MPESYIWCQSLPLSNWGSQVLCLHFDWVTPTNKINIDTYYRAAGWASLNSQSHWSHLTFWTQPKDSLLRLIMGTHTCFSHIHGEATECCSKKALAPRNDLSHLPSCTWGCAVTAELERGSEEVRGDLWMGKPSQRRSHLCETLTQTG